jgi:uncharacterized protein YutE (UPF0331/DUF86 family)
MIDPALIRRKMSLILQDLPRLTMLSRLSLNDYLADAANEALAERYLERTIGRMIDINFHLITELGHAPPKDYHESFARLGAIGVMPAAFAKDLAVAAGLRNRIVHEYDEIDAGKIHEALSVSVRTIPIYLDHVHRFLETLPA